jgi:hypothetical protein
MYAYLPTVKSICNLCSVLLDFVLLVNVLLPFLRSVPVQHNGSSLNKNLFTPQRI